MFDGLQTYDANRRWHGQDYPAPVVVALIRRERPRRDTNEPCYLLIRRKGAPYEGRWALVGGKWDFGETLASAIVREVAEESGLEATFHGVLGVVSERIMPHNDGGKGAHFIIFVCSLSAPNGLALEQEEGEVAWFTLAELETLQAEGTIIPSDFAMIQQFRRREETAVTPVAYIEAEMFTGIYDSETEARLVRFERLPRKRP